MTDTSPAAQWRVGLEDYVSVLEVSPPRHQAVAGSLGCTRLDHPQDLSPATAVESDISTSRLQWVSDGDLLIGRADRGVVKLAI